MDVNRFSNVKENEFLDYEDMLDNEEIEIDAKKVVCPKCGNTFDVFPFLSSCTCEKCRQEIVLDGMPPIYG